ncbi:hypothetical protein AVEN_184370-1 [Araneus ventricosus]|uniref:Uncharacterized protein n=1 Tax=Araneus ventricosus TaxID=182803 RepID=A0A4Y2BFZ4_ARAVE|nr:hypothetical protein AVEN_184370-1 [Araneus ventricosus]
MAAVYPCDWQLPIKIKSGTKSMGKRVSLLKRRIQGFRHTLFKLPFHISGRTFGSLAFGLACNGPNTTNLQWNQVSNLEPFGSEADTLPLGHRGL